MAGSVELAFWRNLEPRDRRALFLGLAVMVPALSYAFVVRPYRAALVDVESRVEAERDLLSRELALLASAPGLPAAIDQAREAAQEVESRLLQAPSLVLAETELTDFLEDAAARNRVLLEEIRGGEMDRGEAPPPGLEVVRVHLRGESDLQGVLDFLNAIEESRLILRIRGLALDPVEARSGGGAGETGTRQSLPTGVLTFQLIVDGFTTPLPDSGDGEVDEEQSG
jgi:hypothetical protein